MSDSTANRAANSILLVVTWLLVCTVSTSADTPANCSYEEILGTWKFMIGAKFPSGIKPNCSSAGETEEVWSLKLMYPDRVADQYGNKGFWTMVYNQGFEVVINNRKFFAFSKYTKSGTNVTSYCDQTSQGWSHDTLERQWACYYGTKIERLLPKADQVIKRDDRHYYRRNDAFITAINSGQSLWRARAYPAYEGMTLAELSARGGVTGVVSRRVAVAPITEQLRLQTARLPAAFDWRRVAGQDFVSPVRNQGKCGSCYAFSSVGMVESRLRVATNNTVRVTLSEQDVVECSPYSQGCSGGFPYLIAGKYAEDFGMVPEKCNPYTGLNGKCHTKSNCTRYYATKYRYVGGYYGACNEEHMKMALVNGGPLSVSFEVHPDFMHYHSGIYRHIAGLHDRFNPFEVTNHAVLLVGYGEDAGVKYWSVRNSWGTQWGEDGFFRIIRGQDECAIESIAVESFSVL